MEINALGEQLVQRTIHSIDKLAASPEGTGLALITLPTGFGKTTNIPEGLARKMVIDHNTFSKVITITNSNNNLYNIEEKFKKSWKRNGLDPEKILLIPATDKPFRTYWEKSHNDKKIEAIFDKNGLNRQYICKNISQSLQEDKKYKDNLENMLKASRSLANKLSLSYSNIDKTLKPSYQEIANNVFTLKRWIKKYVHIVLDNEVSISTFDKNTIKEKLEIVNSISSLSWVKELFPIMKIPENDVILMSTKRFSMSWDLIVEKINNGYQTDKVDSLLGKKPILVIDEIDQLADEINSIIIENAVKSGAPDMINNNENDLIDLTKTLITRLKSFLMLDGDNFPEDIISLSATDKTLNDKFNELNYIYNKFQLGKGRSLDPKLTKSADQFFFVSNEHLQQLNIAKQLSGKSIIYEYGEYINKTNNNRTLFTISSKKRKEARKKYGYKSIPITKLLSLLHKSNENLWNFLYFHRSNTNESKKDFIARFLESIGSDAKVTEIQKLLSNTTTSFKSYNPKNKENVYYRGFDVFSIHPRKDENGYYQNDDPKIYWYFIQCTAEKHLLDMANHYKVIGCSATADINTSLSNFDLSFIKNELGDRFCNAKTLQNDYQKECSLLQEKKKQWELKGVKPKVEVMPAGNSKYLGITLLEALENLGIFSHDLKNNRELFTELEDAFINLGLSNKTKIPLRFSTPLYTNRSVNSPLNMKLDYSAIKKLNLVFAILLFLKNVSPNNSNRSMALIFNSFEHFKPGQNSNVLDAIVNIIKIYINTRPDLKGYLDQGSNIIAISDGKKPNSDCMLQIMKANDINNYNALANVKHQLYNEKNVRIIISMYNTLGTGQDLNYEFADKILKNSDLKNVNPGDRPDRHIKDFDCLYIEKPTYITSLIKKSNVVSSTNNELIINFLTAYMEMNRRLASENAYFNSNFTDDIAKLNNFIQGKKTDGDGFPWSQTPANDECNATWCKLLQVVGRINRTYYKVQEPLIMLDPLLVNYCYKRSSNPSCNTMDVLSNTIESGYQYTIFSPIEDALIASLSEPSIAKDTDLLNIIPMNHQEVVNLKAISKLSLADRKDGRTANFVTNEGYYLKQKVLAVKDIHTKRQQVLAYPSLTAAAYEKLPNFLQNLYMRQSTIPVGGPIAFSYTKPSDDSNIEYTRLSDNPNADDSVFKTSVPDINQILHVREMLTVAPGLKEIFKQNNWATELITNDYQLSPYAIKTYLQGAYGEIIIKWWFQEKLGLRLKTFSEEPKLAPYELMFDFVSPNFTEDGLAIDAKFYTGKTPVDTYFKKRQSKFKHDIFKRFLYINIFVNPSTGTYGVIQDLSNRVGKPTLTFPYIFDLKNHRFLSKEDGMVKKLEGFIHG
ncbi:hypothetical protein PO252_02415 [Limosilactobacillus mucosae]|uniref:hypothetical protein n=1 Tax=Limosilactobacillus mucosae TaxID=97478 RepID=UPI00233E9364|nr:hypothetical protein [Limosilactobacillus mucosae]MDC2838709.1 hypothetical protein [Limosilactobacillus mucosae]